MTAGLLMLYSVISIYIAEPKLHKLHVTQSKCVGVFGEPRCLIPLKWTDRESVYQIHSAYQIPQGVPIYSPEGIELHGRQLGNGTN